MAESLSLKNALASGLVALRDAIAGVLEREERSRRKEKARREGKGRRRKSREGETDDPSHIHIW